MYKMNNSMFMYSFFFFFEVTYSVHGVSAIHYINTFLQCLFTENV